MTGLRIATLLFITVAGPLHAATFANEYELLKKLPPEVQAFIVDHGTPDAQGYTSFNHRDQKWYEAGMQRGGCRMLIGAVLDGDAARAEAAWKAVEVTFAHQLEDGGFESNLKPGDTFPPTKVERVETACFFLQEMARAILVIEASPMSAQFKERIEALRPKLKHAGEFIESGRTALVWKVGHTANRLLIGAKAFGLCGVVLKDEGLKASAVKLIEEALKRRDEGGVFIENQGRDSSYDAVCLLMAQVLGIYLPHPALEDATQKTMAWLRTRVQEDGRVETEGNTRTGVGKEASALAGHPKQVNYPEVAQTFAFYGMLHDDAEYIELAKKVDAYRRTHSL